jgi:hypothetical protein
MIHNGSQSNSIETLAKRHLRQPFDTWSNTILSFYLENKLWNESLSSVYLSSCFLAVTYENVIIQSVTYCIC